MIKKIFKTSLVAIASFAALSSVSIAQAQVLEGVDKKTADQIVLQVSKNAKVSPDAINYVGKSAFPGMYLVMMNGYSVTFMTDKNVSHVMVGNYINAKTNENISETIKNKYQKVDISLFKKENMIVEKKGNGKDVLYVIADANCSFCQKLEKESIPELKDVTIYNIPVSILQPGGPTDKKAKTVLCKPESEQGKLWADLVGDKKGEDGNVDCKKASALEENTEAMRKAGINGTPGIFFPNGKLQPGWVDAATLTNLVKANQK